MTEALRRHAEHVAAAQLARARGRLGGLDAAERAAVEQLARSVAQATASCLLEEAEREPALAAVLTEVYAGADARG